VRFAGGVLFLTGMLVMAYNVWRTVRVSDVAMAQSEAQIA
jgi:cytochrome c oxidase cbb3-type subunit 1